MAANEPFGLKLLLLVSAVTILYKTTAAADSGVSSVTVAHRPELEYLRAVNSVAPPQDPQLLFLLMAEYSNANQKCRTLGAKVRFDSDCYGTLGEM
jgi:hypothetical protein